MGHNFAASIGTLLLNVYCMFFGAGGGGRGAGGINKKLCNLL